MFQAHSIKEIDVTHAYIKKKLDRGETDPTRISLRGATAQLFSAEKPPEPWPIPTRGHALRRTQRGGFLPRGGKIPRNNRRVRQRGLVLAARALLGALDQPV